MDTARYRAFLTAVDTGSFTRAAEVLNYSTSGVSQLISALEDDLGLPLLTRSRRGVSPTPAGETLLPAIRAVVQQEERVLQTASELNGLMTGEVRIATYSSISSHWLPRVIKAFRRDYPNVQIHLMEGIRKEVLQWLSESRADIAFLSEVKGTPYDWIPLAKDPMIAILPPTHPMAGSAAYPLSMVEEEAFIMPAMGKDDDLAELFSQEGIVPSIAYSTMESFAAIAMIENGLGMTITNNLITENWQADVVKLPLDPPRSITMGILLPDRRTLSPAAKKFVEYTRRMAENM
ncbi:MAG: LysR family transcriptional regulator [Oscillospiraceae bacterium]|nr:LysR family transcriptional regulator [Oscillospiraceae bacterium]